MTQEMVNNFIHFEAKRIKVLCKNSVKYYKYIFDKVHLDLYGKRDSPFLRGLKKTAEDIGITVRFSPYFNITDQELKKLIMNSPYIIDTPPYVKEFLRNHGMTVSYEPVINEMNYAVFDLETINADMACNIFRKYYGDKIYDVDGLFSNKLYHAGNIKDYQIPAVAEAVKQVLSQCPNIGDTILIIGRGRSMMGVFDSIYELPNTFIVMNSYTYNSQIESLIDQAHFIINASPMNLPSVYVPLVDLKTNNCKIGDLTNAIIVRRIVDSTISKHIDYILEDNP